MCEQSLIVCVDKYGETVEHEDYDVTDYVIGAIEGYLHITQAMMGKHQTHEKMELEQQVSKGDTVYLVQVIYDVSADMGGYTSGQHQNIHLFTDGALAEQVADDLDKFVKAYKSDDSDGEVFKFCTESGKEVEKQCEFLGFYDYFSYAYVEKIVVK